MGIDFHKLYY